MTRWTIGQGTRIRVVVGADMQLAPVLVVAFLGAALLRPAAGSVAAADAGFLDAVELNDVQYSIVIDGTPVRVGPDGKVLATEEVEEAEGEEPVTPVPPPTFVTMTNKFGQKYRCAVPDISDVRSGRQEEAKEEAAAAAEAASDELTLAQQVKSVLGPMSKGPCLFRTKDWWTYEFCYGGSVRQYHMEGRWSWLKKMRTFVSNPP